MDKDQIQWQEFKGMFDRLDQEVDLLWRVMDSRGEDMDKEYAEQAMRAQLETIGEVVESMSEHLDDGRSVSVTTPSDLGDDEERDR